LKQLARYLLGVGILLWGCGEVETIKQHNDMEYFPLQVGYFQIYAVEHTTYTGLDQSTTLEYDLKTEIIDSFKSPEGSTIFVIHRSKRENESDPWEFIDTWSARLTEFEAIMNEGNTSFVKISFPVFKNKDWNGNALNSLEEELYTLEEVDISFDLENGIEFSDCVVINQQDYIAADRQDFRREVYSRDVGLIFRQITTLEFCTENSCFGQQLPISGIDYHQILKEYGQN